MKPQGLRNLSSLGLPLAVSLLVSACGGGSGDSAPPLAQSNAAGPMARALAATAGDSEAALTPVSATASASERADLGPAQAIDHDENTRWSSGGFSDDQFLVLDYGHTVTVNRVHIDWERAHANQYELQNVQ